MPRTSPAAEPFLRRPLAEHGALGETRGIISQPASPFPALQARPAQRDSGALLPLPAVLRVLRGNHRDLSVPLKVHARLDLRLG